MKHLLIILLTFLTFNSEAQKRIVKTETIKVINDTVLAKLTIYQGKWIEKVEESFLIPEIQKVYFFKIFGKNFFRKVHQYRIISNGKAITYERNGDYCEYLYENDRKVFEKCFLSNGSEINVQEFDKIHQHFIIQGGSRRFIRKGRLHVRLLI